MNVIDKITRFIIPTPLYDVGAGIYHIFKKDVTQEQCEKIVSGAVRIAAVAAIILTGAVLVISGSADLIGLALCGALGVSYFLDQQTYVFLLTSLSMSMGTLGLGVIISNIAKGIFENLGLLIMGQLLFTGGSGLMNLLMYEEGGLFGKEINERCKIWSIDLYLRLHDTYRTKANT
jgi:hypothetical protein